jgi:hypothetical protein
VQGRASRRHVPPVRLFALWARKKMPALASALELGRAPRRHVPAARLFMSGKKSLNSSLNLKGMRLQVLSAGCCLCFGTAVLKHNFFDDSYVQFLPCRIMGELHLKAPRPAYLSLLFFSVNGSPRKLGYILMR